MKNPRPRSDSKEFTVLQEKAYQQALMIRQKAYAPYSQFLVGATFITESGRPFSGCNVENASFGATICAERNALFQWVSHRQDGERLKFLVLVTDTSNPTASPCGLCLQVLSEFCPPDFPLYLANLKGISAQKTLQDLFPHSFKLG